MIKYCPKCKFTLPLENENVEGFHRFKVILISKLRVVFKEREFLVCEAI